MGYRVKPFTMAVRNNSTQEFEDIGLLGSDVDADLRELQEDVSTLQTDIDTISSRVGSSSQKSIVFVGDSYTYGNGISDNTKIFPHLVASKLGVTNRNFAQGGSGFFYGDSIDIDFLSQLQNAVDDTSFDNDDVSYVVISGGINDATQYGTTGKTYSEIYYALDDILTLAETSFPNARIFLIPMLFDANILPIDGYFWYLNLLKAALGGGHKCKVIKNAYSWLCGKFGLIQSDNIHPGVEGHKLLSSCILDAINGGDGFLNYDRLEIVVNNSKLTGSIGLSNDKDSYWFYGTITVATALTRGEGMAGQSLSAYNNIPCYMGNQKFFMTAVRTDNNNNGVYPVDLEFNTTNKTILLRSLAEIPVGSYAVTYQAPFGRYQNAATG